jgi:hypothetical protein
VSQEKKPTPPSAAGGGTPACSPTVPCPLDCPTKVEFKESNPVYGWDDHTDAAVPWESVEKGKTTTAKAEITPAGKFAHVQFTSSDSSKVTVSPATAGSDSQVVTYTGVANGESEIKASCGGSELGKMKVKTYTRKVKTVAVRLVNEKNYNSTNISDADITARLKKVYDQAVVEFTLTRLPAKTVEFDKNKDGKIDVDSWMSDEMKAVRDACKDDSYDFNIFLVDKPSDGSFGFMDLNQRYGFVHADSTSTPLKSLSHELGHGQGLAHRQDDTDNLMKQGEGDNMWRLRKDQWDTINP